MIEAQLSRGNRRLLERLLWYRRKYGVPVHPRQEKLAKGLGVTDRQVRTWLAELRGFCTDQCPDHCDGGNGHVGLVEVHQNGNGRSASYTMNCRDDFRADFRAEILVESQQQTTNESVTDENFRAEPPPVVFSSHSSLEHYPREQHYSPVVNDAACAKNPPERQKPNPKPGNGGNPAFDSEVAEIREALKARPLVRYTPAFDPVIREMLASGETVETIKRAILRGCWLKLKARHDRCDTSQIISARYFLNVIPDVKQMNDPVYWRNIERRLGSEERKLAGVPQAFLGGEAFIAAALSKGWKRMDEESNCTTCYGFGKSDTGEICGCEAGDILLAHLEWCPDCVNTGMVAAGMVAAGLQALVAWCHCIHASRLREREPDAVDQTNKIINDQRPEHRARSNPAGTGRRLVAIA